jgi:hypothetical protein
MQNSPRLRRRSRRAQQRWDPERPSWLEPDTRGGAHDPVVPRVRGDSQPMVVRDNRPAGCPLALKLTFGDRGIELCLIVDGVPIMGGGMGEAASGVDDVRRGTADGDALPCSGQSCILRCYD